MQLAFAVLASLWASPGWLGVLLAEAERPTIAEVIPDSPAERAGLLPGDVVVAVDGRATAAASDLVEALAERPPGRSVILEVQRGDAALQLEVTLGVRPGAADAQPVAVSPSPWTAGNADDPPAPGAAAGAMLPGFGLDLSQARQRASASGRRLLVLVAHPSSLDPQPPEVWGVPELRSALEPFVRVWWQPHCRADAEAMLGTAAAVGWLIEDPEGRQVATRTGLGSPQELLPWLRSHAEPAATATAHELVRELRALRQEVAELRARLAEVERRLR